MSQLVASFFETQSHIAKRFKNFSEDETLENLLRRFDYGQSGTLDPEQSALAARVLGKMHTPSAKGFALLLQVFDFLDVKDNQTLEHEELTLAIEILDLFCKADSVNDTLSAKELGLLLSALQKLDKDKSGVLDNDERDAIRDGLWSPDEFLAELLSD
jgi:Ca2+-binding EF-hand superfamily protein